MYQSELDVYLNEKKEVTIQIKSTVPIACKNSQICSLKVELYSFKHQFIEGSQPYCNTSLLDKDPKPSFCSFDFDGKRWDSYQPNSVTLLRDETSRGSYRAIVQLRAISGMDKLWAQVFLPEMKVMTSPCIDTKNIHIFYVLHVMYMIKDKSKSLKF